MEGLSGLRAKVADKPHSIPSTHMAAHDHLQFQFQGLQHGLLASMDTRWTHGAQNSMQALIIK